MPWCSYTDQDLDPKDMTREHILPLALGGMNGFEIPVCKKFNSDAGSAIDGAVANDFFVLGRRNVLDVRGHSGKRPVLIAKKSKDEEGRPVQVTLDRKEGLKIWSPVLRDYVESPK